MLANLALQQKETWQNSLGGKLHSIKQFIIHILLHLLLLLNNLVRNATSYPLNIVDKSDENINEKALVHYSEDNASSCKYNFSL